MPLTRRLAAAALCFAATPGLASCPTGEDLTQGIVLAQNEPFFQRGDFKATPDGVVEVRIIDRGGQTQERVALYRHGLVMTAEQTATGRVEITYGDALLPIDTLPETGEVAISGIARGPQGAAEVELKLAFVGHGSVALAECAFATWTVNATLLKRDGGRTRVRVEYAPELDLVLAAGEIGPDGTVTPTYAYQWAGTAADVAR